MDSSLFVITGASRGIGAEIVHSLASNPNHAIVATARNEAALTRVRDAAHTAGLKGRIILAPADLTRSDDRLKLCHMIQDLLDSATDISLKGVVQNAGFLRAKPFLEQSEEDWDQHYDILLKAPALLTRGLFPLLGPQSHLVFVSSMGGFQGSRKFPGLTPYSAFKGALSILAECLAEEFGQRAPDASISCNALCLGAVQTEMLEEAFPGLKAPVDAATMGAWIAEFLLNGGKLFNGKVIPVSLRDPG